MTVSAPPETVAQAIAWDKVKANAVRFGLCHRCAAQLAWLLQEGGGPVHPPCDACAPLVATLPKPKPNGWRTVRGSAHDARNWRSESPEDSAPPPVSGDTGGPAIVSAVLRDEGIRGGCG